MSASDQVLQRFMDQVFPEPMSGCWLWGGYLSPGGYGLFRKDGNRISAHRAAHEFFIGCIPEGLEVDHKCSNPSCVNPEHLQAVTCAENNHLKMDRRNGSRDFCRHGHQLTADNTYRNPNKSTRHCRKCGISATIAWKKRTKGAAV